jgi:hypothetical protein
VTTFLPYVDEPKETLRALNSPGSLVKYPAIRTTPREAAIRQGGDLVKPVYAVWKSHLPPAGVTWQDVQAASSENRDDWRAWADGLLPWLSALEGLVERLNARTGGGLGLAA